MTTPVVLTPPAKIKPLQHGAYFRTNALGEGSFGSVMVVYNEDGEEFAAKRFEESDEGDIDSAVLREIAMLRLLSQIRDYPREIIPCLDITTIEEGGLCMIMPKFKSDLYHLIENKQLTKQKDSLSIMYYSLLALKFLHDLGIMHRDLKSDNIMVYDEEVAGAGAAPTTASSGNGNKTPATSSSKPTTMLKPVLIDFSLCKFFGKDPVFSDHKEDKNVRKSKKSASQKRKEKHEKKQNKNAEGNKQKLTAEVGTSTYIAPEVVQGRQDYDERADMWSMGVIFSEILQKKTIQAERDRDAFKELAEFKQKLKPGTPFTTLMSGLLEEKMENRFRCSDAIEILKPLLVQAKIISQENAAAEGEAASVDKDNSKPEFLSAPTAIKQCSLESRNLCKQWTEIIEFGSKTRDTAEAFCGQLEALDGENGFKWNSKWDALYCVLMAGKLWELELIDIWELDDEWADEFKKFDPNLFIERELELGKLLDWNFYWKRMK
ncbi:unnamed protein product [Amoebophrya sp. A120]|nr:unnamed protein product [Amoebophrya sp. A120]|eukprot:GSA120T00007247001.1